MNNTITIHAAANVTYGAITENTRVKVEYKHTGPMTLKNGRKKKHSIGYYFIDRIAIPTTVNGKPDWWYITNEGDSYRINKCSKAWNKIHTQLSEEQQPIKP
jgi:hypothetical protein